MELIGTSETPRSESRTFRFAKGLFYFLAGASTATASFGAYLLDQRDHDEAIKTKVMINQPAIFDRYDRDHDGRWSDEEYSAYKNR